jgi:hypothetical protein
MQLSSITNDTPYQNKKRYLGKFSITNIHQFFSILTIMLFLSYVFAFQYGFNIIAGDALRITDVIAILCIGCGLLILTIHQKVIFHRSLFLVIPFMFLEFSLPLVGSIVQDDFLAATSIFRFTLYWFPALMLASILRDSDIPFVELLFTRAISIAIIANLLYALIQMLVYEGLISEVFLITKHFESWVIDTYKFSKRVSGFFGNSTSLGILGVIGMVFFLAKSQAQHASSDIFLMGLSIIIVILSTSRAIYVCALGIMAIFLITNHFIRSFQIFLIITLMFIPVSFMIDQTVGVDSFFQRFTRLQEEGINEDYSWTTRRDVLWPQTIRLIQEHYPFGTLVHPIRYTGIIDSGYLTYYAQGKWVFLGALLILIFPIMWKGFRIGLKKHSWSGLFLFYLSIYILIHMIVTNPMRSGLVIFVLLLGIRFFSYDIKKKIK